MAIRFKHGKVSSLAKLAKLAGEAKQAQIDQQRRQQMLSQVQEMAHQERMASFQAQVREQAEQNDFQRQIALQEQSQNWEMQKMALRSQHDFEMQEKQQEALFSRNLAKKIQKMDERDQAIDLVTKDQSLSAAQKNELIREINLRSLGVGGMAGLGAGQTQKSPIDQFGKVQNILNKYSPAKPDTWSSWGGTPAMINKREATPQEVSIMESLRQNPMQLMEETGQQQPAQRQAITATNPKTGEKIVSYDGGNSWQPMK